MFFIYALSIWGAVITHVFYRTQGLLGLRWKGRLAFGCLFYLAGFAYIPARYLIREDPASWFAADLAHGAAIVIGFVAILWTLVMLLEVIALITWMAKGGRIRSLSLQARRSLAGLWWCVSGILAVLGMLAAQATPEVTMLRLSVPGATEARYAVISDTHLGAISSMDQWRRTLEASRLLDPEGLLLVGDLIDDRSTRTEVQFAMIREFFPTEPVYAVTGNHERYTGIEFYETLCQRYRIRLLRQEVETLTQGLSIAGVDDGRGDAAGRAVEKLLPAMTGPAILLAHRPETARLLSARPETLILSGHTHGGQTLPMTFLVPLGNSGFSAGFYAIGEALLYVSKGAGVWGPPLRLFAPSEIVILEVLPGARFEVATPEPGS